VIRGRSEVLSGIYFWAVIIRGREEP
jgi:hypothetical protein